MSGRNPEVCVINWRTVTASFPSPVNSGMILRTRSSKLHLPALHQHMTAGVQATTFVNDAASKIVSSVIVSVAGTTRVCRTLCDNSPPCSTQNTPPGTFASDNGLVDGRVHLRQFFRVSDGGMDSTRLNSPIEREEKPIRRRTDRAARQKVEWCRLHVSARRISRVRGTFAIAGRGDSLPRWTDRSAMFDPGLALNLHRNLNLSIVCYRPTRLVIQADLGIGMKIKT